LTRVTTTVTTVPMRAMAA